MVSQLQKLLRIIQAKVDAVAPVRGKMPTDVQSYVRLMAAVNGLQFILQLFSEGIIKEEDLNA